MSNETKIIEEQDGQMAIQIVNTEASAQLAGFFKDIDFNTISAAIQKMADNSTSLTEKEKEMSMGIIEQWESDVIDAIEDKRMESNKYLTTLSPENSSITISDDEFEMIVIATGTDELYKKYLELKEKAAEIANSPLPKFEEDLNDTVESVVEMKAINEAEQLKHRIAVSKAYNLRDNALLALKKEMNKHDAVKDFIKKAGKYQKSINKFKKECREKGQLAKISISVSNTEVRDALKELLAFSVNV